MLKQLVKDLKQLNIPFTYRAFPKAKSGKGQQPLPFLLYYVTDETSVKADNNNVFDIENVTIELYTKNKDLKLEKQLKNILNKYTYNHIEEVFIESEECFVNYFEISLLI